MLSRQFFKTPSKMGGGLGTSLPGTAISGMLGRKVGLQVEIQSQTRGHLLESEPFKA